MQLREDAASGGESRESGMQKLKQGGASKGWVDQLKLFCLLATFWTHAVMVEPNGLWETFPRNGTHLHSLVLGPSLAWIRLQLFFL